MHALFPAINHLYKPVAQQKISAFTALVNIIVVAVGIGKDINHVELRSIASSPETVFTVDNFSELQNILKYFITQTCRIITTPPPATPRVEEVKDTSTTSTTTHTTPSTTTIPPTTTSPIRPAMGQ
jgi:hypothetical protein